MLRFGRISELDNALKKGIIIDSNHQDIGFEFEGRLSTLKINDQVSFDIAMRHDGLIAIAVKKVFLKIRANIRQ